MKKFYASVNKYAIHIYAHDSYLYSNCNYCSMVAYRTENGFSVELSHVIKRNDEITKIHYHNIGHVRTVADVFDVAKEYVKIGKIYK